MAERRALAIIPYIPFPSGTVVVAAGGIGAAAFTQAAADKSWSSATRALTDKAGFTLTAGSYSVRASNTQHGVVTTAGGTSATAAISSVALTKATINQNGHQVNAANIQLLMWCELTNATTVTAASFVASTQSNRFVVTELV